MSIKELKNKIKLKNAAGFTLLETLVAVVVLVFAFLGPVTLSTFSIRSAGLSEHQLVAAYLAQEAMEYVRNKRDSNDLNGDDWVTGLNQCWSGPGCCVDVYQNRIENFNNDFCNNGGPIKFDNTIGVYNYSIGVNTPFTRKIKVVQPGTGCYPGPPQFQCDFMPVAVTVSWQERFVGSQSLTLAENLLNWPKR